MGSPRVVRVAPRTSGRALGRFAAIERDILMTWVPAVYPLCLILGLIAIPGGNLVLRLGLLASAAPGLLRLDQIGPTHRRFFALIGTYLAVVAVASFAAVKPEVALVDLQRQAFLLVVAAGLSLALTHDKARVTFNLGALGVSAVATASILLLYVGFSGITQLGPIQESFKTYAAGLGDFENAVSFAAVLAIALAAPVLARWPVILAFAVVAVAAAVAVSGSRTTLVAVVACIPLTVALLSLHRLRRIPLWIPYGTIGVGVAWVALTFGDRLGRLAVSPTLNEITTGRSTLWAAAWSKFIERPVFGWGGGSFPVDLGSFLPGGTQIYFAENSVVLSAHGGAHNALLTVLAERGLFAALAALAVSAFLVWHCILVFRSRGRLHGIDRAFAALAPFAVVAILVRSLGEAPGWFGLADGLVDFLAYGFAAMLVAVASRLERRPGEARRSQPPVTVSG